MTILGQEFSMWAIYWCMFSLVGMIFLAWQGGTLLSSSRLRVNIPLFKHEGIFWGYLPMALVNGLVLPHITFVDWHMYFNCIAMPASLFFSYYLHEMWWPKTEEDFCPTMPSWERSDANAVFWYLDMAPCGWLHVVMFAVEIFVYAVFFSTSMPMVVQIVVFICSVVQFPLGVVQPYLMAELKRFQERHPWRKATITALVVDALVALAMGIKLHFS